MNPRGGRAGGFFYPPDNSSGSQIFARLIVGLFLPELGTTKKLFSLMLTAAEIQEEKKHMKKLIMALSCVELSSLLPIVTWMFSERASGDA